MNIFELMLDKPGYDAHKDTIYGVVIGVVSNNKDPDNLGRVKVRFPWLSEDNESNWARVATLMAGKERGSFFLPEVDDEVLVTFEHGDVRFPYILGMLWNGVDKPPFDNGDGKNNLRVIKSRSGHIIKLDDKEGSEKIEIVDKTGSNSITIDSSENKMTLQVDGDIELKASNGKIILDAQSVEIKSSAETKIEAGSTMNVEASSAMTIKGQPVNIN